MELWWTWAAIIALFALGLRLSAFFSGSEIGFYRVSPLRLGVEADSGDAVSARLLHFVQRPSYFVATTLVGNNIANYITALAITLATAAAFSHSSWLLEIAGTMLFSPLIFIFGELIPKNLYYEAPHRYLRKDSRWFVLFYWLFIPFSFPLVWLCQLFERIGRREQNGVQMMLGKTRLVQLLSEGHEEGLLTRVQNELVQGLLGNAPKPITETMTEVSRVVGVHDNLTRQATLKFAHRHGLALVPVRHTKGGTDWYGYVSVANLALHDRPIRDMVMPLFHIDSRVGKLEAILTLRAAGREYAAVYRNGAMTGLVTESELVEEFFISQQTARR